MECFHCMYFEVVDSAYLMCKNKPSLQIIVTEATFTR